jgi:hypothetical protein
MFLLHGCESNLFSGMLQRVAWYKSADVSYILATSVIGAMMKAVSIPETSVNFYQTTQCNMLKDCRYRTVQGRIQ